MLLLNFQYSPLTRDLRGYFGGEESSQRMLRMPVYQVTDPAAVGLGEYGGAAGKFGFALKPQTGWTSVYVGAVAVFPPELFRGLARLAGLPVYSSDGDPLFFAQELLAVHASFDGVHTLTLPAAADVSSLWDDTALGRVKVIRRPMRTGDNALYRLRP